MKSKPLRPPPPEKQHREKEENEESQDEMEMEAIAEVDNEDKDYYFEDPLNIGITSSTNSVYTTFIPLVIIIVVWTSSDKNVLYYTQLLCFTVSAHSDIPEAEFPDYVRLMHQERDKKLENEFKVQYHSLNFGCSACYVLCM